MGLKYGNYPLNLSFYSHKKPSYAIMSLYAIDLLKITKDY